MALMSKRGSNSIRLRLAEPRDMKAVFELSNDPVVRANSIHKEPIAWETHVVWFTKAIADDGVKFFVAETSSSEFVGQIRFNLRDGYWVVSISIVPSFRGRGITKSLLLEAMSKIPGGKFIAEIAAANEPSKRLFASAGFAEDVNLNAPVGFQTFVRQSV